MVLALLTGFCITRIVHKNNLGNLYYISGTLPALDNSTSRAHHPPDEEEAPAPWLR